MEEDKHDLLIEVISQSIMVVAMDLLCYSFCKSLLCVFCNIHIA